VRWTAGFDEDEEGIVRFGVAGFARRERAAKRGGGFSGIPIETEEGKGRGIGGRRATVGENAVGARPTRFRGRGA
jgi:hypothetical protein